MYWPDKSCNEFLVDIMLENIGHFKQIFSDFFQSETTYHTSRYQSPLYSIKKKKAKTISTSKAIDLLDFSIL